MSAALQSTFTDLLLRDYLALVALTAIGYDYILTLPNEVAYIWSKPWTRISVLFFIVRYVGFYSAATFALVGSSLLPGSAKTYVFVLLLLSGNVDMTDNSETVVCILHEYPLIYVIHGLLLGQMMVIINNWAFCLFIGAADAVMILRVWAMYDRSKMIFGILLALFSAEMISNIIVNAEYSDPTKVQATTIQTLGFVYCLVVPPPPVGTAASTILQITNGTVTCILAIVQFARQSLRMYRATKQWQPNRYMKLLVKQGVLYFLITFLRLTNIVNVLAASGELPRHGWQLMLLSLVQYLPMFTLIPRFIMSIREMYVRDAGFGFASPAQDAVMTAIVFAGARQEEESVEEIPMDGNHSIHVGEYGLVSGSLHRESLDW